MMQINQSNRHILQYLHHVNNSISVTEMKDASEYIKKNAHIFPTIELSESGGGGGGGVGVNVKLYFSRVEGNNCGTQT